MTPTILTVDDVLPRLLGTGEFRRVAASEGYTDAHINNRVIPDAIRSFERDTRFRVSPIRVITDDDGSFSADSTYPILRRDMQPYNNIEQRFYLRFQALEAPIRSILRLRLQLAAGHPLMTIPNDWVQFEARTGYVWMQPVTGSAISAGTAAASFAIFEAMRLGRYNVLPQSIALDFEAGLPDGWQSDQEWGDVFRALTCRCAIAILRDWSQVFDAGITNKSVTALGISQSVQMTRFADRIEALQREEREIIEGLRGESVPIMMGVI